MPSREHARHPLLLLSTGTIAGWMALWLMWKLWIGGMVLAAASGEGGFQWLVSLIDERRVANPAWDDPEHVVWVASTIMTRIGMVWGGAVATAILVIRRRSVARRLGGFLTETDAALNLAILRIATFGTLLMLPAGGEEFIIHVGLPDALLFPPSGLGPLLASNLPEPGAARVMLYAWIMVTTMAAAGFLTRPATIASAVLTLVILGVPQLHGKVNHSHHLVWFAILLATSRCGDVLSVDAWLGRRRQAPASDIRYGLPLHFAWLLLGMVYFFPGIWKLWTGGADWIFSDHLRHQIWHQWTTHATWKPMINPTDHPWLLRAGGLGVVAFELSFIFMMFDRRTRILAFVLGLGFHLANMATLNIAFISLMGVYVVLIDWQRLLAATGIRSIRLGIGRTDGPHPRGSLIPNIVAGTVLLAGNAWYGFRGDNYGWPFACYPKFAYPIREPVRSVIELDIVDPDGRVVTESFATGRGPLRTARWIGVVSRVLKLPDGPQRDAALGELARLAVGDRPSGTELRFHRARYSTRPQDRDEPPINRVLLATSVTAPTTSATDQGQIEPASSTQ